MNKNLLIKEARKKRKLTQTALGLKCGVSQSKISFIENYDSVIFEGLKKKLSKALKIPIESLD